MKKVNKLLVSVLFPILFVSFFVVGSFSVLAQDTSVLSMSGEGWSLKVDASLPIVLDSRNVPYVSVQKSGSEKELFLSLNSLKDCVAGQVEFKVATVGLSVFKQLPLDRELNVSDYDFVNATVALRKGQVVVSRPMNVVNSFACFDGSGRKVLHIYASRLIDAKGNSVWVDSDLEGGLLTVYLDMKFLELAVFPVLVDPTFGYTSIGGTDGSFVNEGTLSMNFTLSQDAYVDNITCYESGSGVVVSYGLYDNDGNRLGVTDSFTSAGSPEWTTKALQSPVLCVAGNYFLSFAITSGSLAVKFDYVTPEQTWKDEGVLPVSIDGDLSKLTRVYSIYANYTVYVAPTPTPSPSPVPSSTPSTFTVVLGEADWVLFLEVVMLVACFVTMGWFNRVPLFGYLVGFFAFVVGIYVLIGGLWSSSLAIGFFGVFVGVVGGLTMLFAGLGVRVRGRR